MEKDEGQHLLVFGASGVIGGAVVQAALHRGWRVTGVARQLPSTQAPAIEFIELDPLSADFLPAQLASSSLYTSVCWAQGTNANDSIYDLDMARHRQIYEANCSYILVTLQALLQQGYLAARSRLCILSSIWQNLARQSKLSYCMSKAALQGLVLSASADLAADGHLINAVLPGAIDTPMTRRNLTAAQIEGIASATGHHRLVTLDDVASLVCYLCSPDNNGITGQFIAADLGFSHVRLV
jgi:NAD(P)-dependent dehydrogenase (short-subunit alcohol dehydrogenase family)